MQAVSKGETMTLLEKAKAAPAGSRSSQDLSEELEMVLAWVGGTISGNQVAAVLKCSHAGVSSRCGVILRRGIQAGIIEVKYRNA